VKEKISGDLLDADPVDEAVHGGERLDPLAWATRTRELDLLVCASG
jgi:hypothetical protein